MPLQFVCPRICVSAMTRIAPVITRRYLFPTASKPFVVILRTKQYSLPMSIAAKAIARTLSRTPVVMPVAVKCP